MPNSKAETVQQIIAGLGSDGTTLDLGYEGIGDEGVQALASAMAQGKTLNMRMLNLNNNSIGVEGARALASAIAQGHTPNLQLLHLNNNSIGTEGVLALARAIAQGKTPKLEVLKLIGNNIEPENVAWGTEVPAEVLKAGWLAVAQHLEKHAGGGGGGGGKPSDPVLPAPLAAAEQAAHGVAQLALSPAPAGGGGRTLAVSAFKAAYSGAEAADDDLSLMHALKQFLQDYCKLQNLPGEQGTALLTAVRKEANAMSEDWFTEGLTDVIGMAQRLWSSTSRGCGDRELCSLLNEALRTDAPELMPSLAVFARTLNAGLITRRALAGALPWPPNHQTFRGAILPQEHLEWYQRMVGCKYRVPGFLATSFEQDTADEFAQRAWQAKHAQHPAVLYVIKLDPDGATRRVRRCQHVSLIRKSNVQTEAEFLYVPYSAFSVSEVRVSAKPDYLSPHVVVLQSAVDNMTEPEDLPLAPWY